MPGLSAYSVKDLQERYAVGEDTVLSWIRDGVLCAIDVSRDGDGRPDWRITVEALAAFEKRRSSCAGEAEAKQEKRGFVEDKILRLLEATQLTKDEINDHLSPSQKERFPFIAADMEARGLISSYKANKKGPGRPATVYVLQGAGLAALDLPDNLDEVPLVTPDIDSPCLDGSWEPVFRPEDLDRGAPTEQPAPVPQAASTPQSDDEEYQFLLCCERCEDLFMAKRSDRKRCYTCWPPKVVLAGKRNPEGVAAFRAIAKVYPREFLAPGKSKKHPLERWVTEYPGAKPRRKAVLVMEEERGRRLTSAECQRIEFLDGDRTNCDPSNLHLVTWSKKIPPTCDACGVELKKSEKGVCRKCADKSLPNEGDQHDDSDEGAQEQEHRGEPTWRQRLQAVLENAAEPGSHDAGEGRWTAV